jgi:hypothetical protein
VIGILTVMALSLTHKDLSFFKNLQLAGAQRLQFRWEIYKITNTANFAPPNGSFDNPQFGRISSTGNSIARQMQLAVKYMF